MIQSWRLDDRRQTLVLGCAGDRLAKIVYWGACLPDDEDLATLHAAHGIDVTGGMLDKNPEVSICPEATRSFPGQPGLFVDNADGTALAPTFTLDTATARDNGLTLRYRDQDGLLSYTADFEIDPVTHVIAASATLKAARPVHLSWLAAPVFPAPQLSDEMIDIYTKWVAKYPIVSIEDGLDQNDWEGYVKLTKALGDKIQIMGDDFFVTNTSYLRKGIDMGACNSILIKLNQIGTVTETIECINLAKRYNYTAVVSHRSGETEDTFLADLVVACETGQIKTGSMSRTDRIAKYNQLMRIEDAMEGIAEYAGKNAFYNIRK